MERPLLWGCYLVPVSRWAEKISCGPSQKTIRNHMWKTQSHYQKRNQQGENYFSVFEASKTGPLVQICQKLKYIISLFSNFILTSKNNLTAFWGSKFIFLSYFLGKDRIMNCLQPASKDLPTSTLTQLKACILRILLLNHWRCPERHLRAGSRASVSLLGFTWSNGFHSQGYLVVCNSGYCFKNGR